MVTTNRGPARSVCLADHGTDRYGAEVEEPSGPGAALIPPAVLDLLLIEDDPGDVVLVTEALSEPDSRIAVHVVRDGTSAMAFLRREGEYADAPRPGLVLLDLNLPGVDGRQVLAEVKADEELRRIPVVVLTSSDAEQDVVDSYGRYANAYIGKPSDADGFASVIHRIDTFFTTVVKLPI